MTDKVQKYSFMYYNAPSSETFRLWQIPVVRPIGSLQTEPLCASLYTNGNIERKGVMISYFQNFFFIKF
jgi:hypothetical protein